MKAQIDAVIAVMKQRYRAALVSVRRREWLAAMTCEWRLRRIYGVEAAVEVVRTT